MDREVILKVGEEERSLGYVSDFLIPRDDLESGDTVFYAIRDAIGDAIGLVDIDGCETEPLYIEIK